VNSTADASQQARRLCDAQRVSFFDVVPPPEPPREPEYRPPEWVHPPDNVMPATCALDALIVRRDDLAVWVADALAYPTGLVFELVAVQRHGSPPERRDRPWFFHPGTPESPRFGVGFADGRRASFDRGLRHGADGPPDIMLTFNGGGGTDRRWNGRMWLWPQPPEGPLTFAFVWPEQGVEEITVEIDSHPVRAAAARAVELWPDERPLPPASGQGRWATT
jgi:hypothetical protein